MTMVPELLEAGVRVIDLAADFRLRQPEVWEHWYGMSHACPGYLDEAVYGLTEINRDAVREARLVANPGCYPTAVQLGLLPLVERQLVDTDHLIADAKSGVSGAGRKAATGTLLCEAGENFKAYGVAGHRHLPEIRQGLEAAAGRPVGLESRDVAPEFLPAGRREMLLRPVAQVGGGPRLDVIGPQVADPPDVPPVALPLAVRRQRGVVEIVIPQLSEVLRPEVVVEDVPHPHLGGGGEAPQVDRRRLGEGGDGEPQQETGPDLGAPEAAPAGPPRDRQHPDRRRRGEEAPGTAVHREGGPGAEGQSGVPPADHLPQGFADSNWAPSAPSRRHGGRFPP